MSLSASRIEAEGWNGGRVCGYQLWSHAFLEYLGCSVVRESADDAVDFSAGGEIEAGGLFGVVGPAGY